MSTEIAYVSITKAGFVDGACFTTVPKESERWISEAASACMCVIETTRDTAKQLLFTTLPSADLSSSNYGRMIVARTSEGEVQAAGWDCAETRADAKEWLELGLSLELVDAEHVHRLGQVNKMHVFATHTPAGDVLTKEQAAKALSGY